MSVFKGQPATPAQVAASVAQLQAAFPLMQPEFFTMLTARIVASGMQSDRLAWAVNHVLDTFTYQRLTVADILAQDKRCRLYTYAEVCKAVSDGADMAKDFAVVKVGKDGRTMWVTTADKERYNIQETI